MLGIAAEVAKRLYKRTAAQVLQLKHRTKKFTSLHSLKNVFLLFSVNALKTHINVKMHVLEDNEIGLTTIERLTTACSVFMDSGNELILH